MTKRNEELLQFLFEIGESKNKKRGKKGQGA